MLILLLGLSALLSGAVGQSLEDTVPGVPGDDYPIYAEVPDTSFLCDGLVEGGYYADPEAECQAFHICGSDGNGGLTKYSFLCPNGTIFQQQYFVCDWWFNVDCSLAEDLYSINEDIAAEREAYSGSGGTFGEKILTETDGAGGETSSSQSSPGTRRTTSRNKSVRGNTEGTRNKSRGTRGQTKGTRKSPSRQSNNAGSLSSYGNKARPSNGLTGGYEAIGSPGFGGQGSFGPDGVFSAEDDLAAGSGLASYSRNAREIMFSRDYLNLEDY